MQKKATYLIFLSYIAAFLIGCGEDVDKYTEVADTSVALLKDPDNFCNYVANNMTEMSSKEYLKCSSKKINDRTASIKREQDRCDDIYRDYVGPPVKGYMLLKCDEEHGVNAMRTAISIIEEFQKIGDGGASCSDISFLITLTKNEWNALRQEYINFGLEEPYPEWTIWITEVTTKYESNLVCRTKVKDFLGIEYEESYK